MDHHRTQRVWSDDSHEDHEVLGIVGQGVSCDDLSKAHTASSRLLEESCVVSVSAVGTESPVPIGRSS